MENKPLKHVGQKKTTEGVSPSPEISFEEKDAYEFQSPQETTSLRLEDPARCRVILSNSGIFPLQCTGWKTIEGCNSFPPSPVVASKEKVEFIWKGSDYGGDIKAAFKYQCGAGFEESMSLFVYFCISSQSSNGFVIKLIQGNGIHLDHLQNLESSLQLSHRIEKVHLRTHYCIATLSEDRDATLIIDLWNDYG